MILIVLLLFLLFVCLYVLYVHRKTKVQVEAGPKLKKAEKFMEEKILWKFGAAVLNVVQI